MQEGFLPQGFSSQPLQRGGGGEMILKCIGEGVDDGGAETCREIVGFLLDGRVNTLERKQSSQKSGLEE